jgi:acyl carrier protein phosphodiesterase
MNFLAHAYLSGDNDLVLVGNFMGDSVKGNQWNQYQEDLQKGILLHRSIDDFTDHHDVVREVVRLIRPTQGKFAAAAADIYFDHFLARHWDDYHNDALRIYSDHVLNTIEKHQHLLVGHSQHFFEYAKKTDRLYSYQFMEGIEEVFQGMSRRVKATNNFLEAKSDLENNYAFIEEQFKAFFPELKNHIQTKFPDLGLI